MAPSLDFRVIFLLVNSKIHETMSHRIFQTQKGVNLTLPKTYPYMTLSDGTNNLAVLAVCKNFILMAPFWTPDITVERGLIVVLKHIPSIKLHNYPNVRSPFLKPK